MRPAQRTQNREQLFFCHASGRARSNFLTGFEVCHSSLVCAFAPSHERHREPSLSVILYSAFPLSRK
jgi:hypothetical protein